MSIDRRVAALEKIAPPPRFHRPDGMPLDAFLAVHPLHPGLSLFEMQCLVNALTPHEAKDLMDEIDRIQQD